MASQDTFLKSVYATTAKPVAVAKTEERNLHRNIVDDQVRIMYCTACGYRQNFDQIKTHLVDAFPHLVDRVYGANYEVDSYKRMLAQFLTYAQTIAIPLLLFGEYVLPVWGANVLIIRWARENRLMVFFIAVAMGTIANSLTASGAFEIYFNDDLIFSKLKTGRWPTLQEVTETINELNSAAT